MSNQHQLTQIAVIMGRPGLELEDTPSLKLRQIFDMIRNAHGVYLFDEFDAIGADRSMDKSETHQQHFKHKESPGDQIFLGGC